MLEPPVIRVAAAALVRADALLVSAGAGMGVDSGLPDFRGNQGFWRAYPPFRALGLSFVDLASPGWFLRDPHLAWGFYGHRMHLYRATVPHTGFSLLKRWGEQMPRGSFVFTSNVDGQFQRAGFSEERVVECHGSIHYLQCSSPCSGDLWRAHEHHVDVDPETFRAQGTLPTCERCGQVARPNILMFGDWSWLDSRAQAQHVRFERWIDELSSAKAKLVVLELGAGTAVPTVRRVAEHLVRSLDGTLVRINPRDADVPDGHISIPLGAREALEAIEVQWRHLRGEDR